MAKKKVKKEEVVADVVKQLYRVERINGGWSLVTVKVNQNGQVLSTTVTPEDVLPNILYKLEQAVREEYEI